MDRFEATARKKADRLVREFNDTRKKLYQIAEKLRELQPYSRDAYFKWQASTPEQAARMAWIFMVMANDVLGDFDSSAFGLRPDATFAQVAPLFVEYVARRGWTRQFQQILDDDFQLALKEIENKPTLRWNIEPEPTENTPKAESESEVVAYA